MNEKVKLGFQLLALVITALIVYNVALLNVRRLSEKIGDANEELGGLRQKIKDLGEVTGKLETETKTIQQSVDEIGKTDTVRVGIFLAAIERAREPRVFIEQANGLEERVANLESRKLSCTPITREDHEDFAGCGDGFYELVRWCSGDCSGDDSKVTICCKP